MEPVAMSLHETAHFSMEVNDMIGNDEWSSIRNATTGLGRVRLGPEHRLFIVSYFHEMHCLLELQHGMLYPGTYPEVWGTPEKVRYCINYLRQMFLCSASDMLEKGDFLASTFEAGTVGDDLVCQDWPVLLGEMQQNYDEYLDWYREWN
ncbi:hypothetical protein EW026_g4463 [Hermanssonia centrifuga]|nr:hypothetical protein EW026_g4463 [Hermanssonia centrifuga]